MTTKIPKTDGSACTVHLCYCFKFPCLRCPRPFTWQFGVYVAGPMYTSGDLLTNARQGIDASHAVHAAAIPGVKLHCFTPQACNVVSQVVHPRGHVEAQEWDDHFLRTACKFVLRLPGASRGADHEVELARELGIPVFGNGHMTAENAIANLLLHVRETYGTPGERVTVAVPSFDRCAQDCTCAMCGHEQRERDARNGVLMREAEAADNARAYDGDD